MVCKKKKKKNKCEYSALLDATLVFDIFDGTYKIQKNGVAVSD